MSIQATDIIGSGFPNGILCMECEVLDQSELETPIFAGDRLETEPCQCCGKNLLDVYADGYSGHKNGCPHVES
jgi:hypothetical protein